MNKKIHIGRLLAPVCLLPGLSEQFGGGSYRLSEAGTQGIKLNLKLILEYQASQLAIYSICILLSSYCHFDILREVTKKDYLIPKLPDQA